MDACDKEQLQEVLLELKHSHAREKRLSDENRAILDAISAMSGANNRQQIFLGLQTALSKYIDVEDFIVISRSNGTHAFETLLTTNAAFQNIAWNKDKKFTRVLNGECIILFEPATLDEFTSLNCVIREEVKSVLMTGINAEVTQSVLLLIGRRKGQFSLEDKQTLIRFSPLIERAIIDIENKEKLNNLVEARTRALTKAQQDAIKANNAKSEFLAMMSHEIRTPLNSVLGMLDIMKQTKINVQQLEILTQMESSAELLLAIISDILDVSKIESGNFSLNKQWTNINDTVTFVIGQLQNIADKKGLQLRTSNLIETEKLHWIDSTRLSQILFNIIGNAIKFTPDGYVDISLNINKNNQLIIEVIDTGIGIQQKKLPFLFNPFHQADSSITRRFGGTGLGLAITKHLVQLMDGKISVESKLGKGSKFTISIPVLSKCNHEPQEDSRTQIESPSLNILVVEDTHTNQMVIKLLLSRLGHSVTIAGNGLEAYEYIQKHHQHLDLVFMDISMPVMDGLAATKVIRSQGINIPIIALTAHAMENDKHECFSVGMNDFITKPVRSSDIEEVLHQLTAKLPQNHH